LILRPTFSKKKRVYDNYYAAAAWSVTTLNANSFTTPFAAAAPATPMRAKARSRYFTMKEVKEPPLMRDVHLPVRWRDFHRPSRHEFPAMLLPPAMTSAMNAAACFRCVTPFTGTLRDAAFEQRVMPPRGCRFDKERDAPARFQAIAMMPSLPAGDAHAAARLSRRAMHAISRLPRHATPACSRFTSPAATPDEFSEAPFYSCALPPLYRTERDARQAF